MSENLTNFNISSHKEHKFHLVNPSILPITGAAAVFLTAVSGVLFMHDFHIGKILLPAGFLSIFLIMYLWWHEVIKEGRVDKAHTDVVRKGLRLGMALFILSEVMFFFAFFFSFFHVSLFPVDILSDVWPIKEGVWPPEGTKTLDPWDIPFMNTVILLLSGTTVTWAHHALLTSNKEDLVKALGFTVILGIMFTAFQAYEYRHALHDYFGFSDNVYTTNFFMATGFHGLHVIIGTIFLTVCYFRAKKGHFSEKHHLGFEFAAWYWHFVDVVWLFLFTFIYVFGS